MIKAYLQSQEQNGVRIFDQGDIKRIVDFQLTMASELENIQLDRTTVEKAVNYLIDHQELGFFLLKQSSNIVVANIVVGSLLVSGINGQEWWFSSVFIDKVYRSQGHFKGLFKRFIEIAKQKGIKYLKNYVLTHEQNLIQMYEKFGMYRNGQTFYAFPLDELQLEKSNDFKVLTQQILEAKSFGLKDLLQNPKPLNNKQLHILKNGEIRAIVSCFNEFSQWSFGMVAYIQSFMVKEDATNQEITQFHNALCKFLKLESKINTFSVKYIIRNKNSNLFEMIKGGKILPYYVMQMDL